MKRHFVVCVLSWKGSEHYDIACVVMLSCDTQSFIHEKQYQLIVDTAVTRLARADFIVFYFVEFIKIFHLFFYVNDCIWTIMYHAVSSYNNVGKLCSISMKTESVTVDAIQTNKHTNWVLFYALHHYFHKLKSININK